MNYHCRICDNSLDNGIFPVREMMFGTRESFIYFRCSSCGCIQIAEVLQDMSEFYPRENYYSFQLRNNISHPIHRKIRKMKNLVKYILINIYLNLPS